MSYSTLCERELNLRQKNSECNATRYFFSINYFADITLEVNLFRLELKS